MFASLEITPRFCQRQLRDQERPGEGKGSERITSGKGDEGMVYGMDPGENFGEFVRTQLPVGAVSLLVQCLGEAGTGFLYLGVLSTSFC